MLFLLPKFNLIRDCLGFVLFNVVCLLCSLRSIIAMVTAMPRVGQCAHFQAAHRVRCTHGCV